MKSSIRARASVRPGMRVVATLVIAAFALTACVPTGTDLRSESPELQLYTGEIPSPAALSSSGASALMAAPTPPTDPNDAAAMEEYERAIEAFVEAMQNAQNVADAAAFAEQVEALAAATKRSDAASVAAWQSLLVAAGIAVGTGPAAVEVSGMTGFGIPMTTAELRLHALAGATDSGMLLTELAHVLEGIGFPAGSLAQALYDDLTMGRDRDFGLVFITLAPDVWGTFDPTAPIDGHQSVALEDVTLSAAQVNLVLRRLSAELLQMVDEAGGTGASASPVPGAGFATASFTSVAAAGPCTVEEDPWKAEARNQGRKGSAQVFGKVLELIPGDIGSRIRFGVGAAQLLLSLATVATKMYLLQADMTMPNAPLVRTKTDEPGEVRDLTMRFSLNENTMRELNECLNQMLGKYGFEFSTEKSGAMAGIGVGFRLMDRSRVWIDARGGTETYEGNTDENGNISFGLEGRPQSRTIPDAADSEDVTVPVRADANVNDSTFMKEMLSLPWTALGGSLGIVPELLSRWKLMTFTWDAPVRDWTMESEFEVTLEATLTSHNGSHVAFIDGCSGQQKNSISTTTASGTIATAYPVRVFAELLTDGTASGVLLRAVDPGLAQPTILDEAAGLIGLFELPVSHTADKRSPGDGPIPPPNDEPEQWGCGDGGGGGTPGPEPVVDCGTRTYGGFLTLAQRDGRFVLLKSANDFSQSPWMRCGGASWVGEPLSAPQTLSRCTNPELSGGAIPAGFFDPEIDRFDVTGTMTCSRDGEGSLGRYHLAWEAVFCRVVEGEPAC